MSQKIDIGEQPAFPADSKTQDCGGLTKREYFAGLAMQGLVTCRPFGDYEYETYAKRSLEYADSLLTELNK